MERKVEQALKSCKEGKQPEARIGRSSSFCLLQAAIVPFVIGMVPVLLHEKPAFGEVDKEEVETSIILETKFRSTSRENFSGKSVFDMLKDKDLYDGDWNASSSGFTNDYKLKNDGKVVFDHASGLMWQQSGTAKDISYDEAKEYVTQLNGDQFAGYNDWRLPTLEEAMSLMESTGTSGGLNIDPVFDNTQIWIWTSDINDVSL
ncbi:MAG: Lcl C-terminal domain-containing protein, partial [Planctomycetota bacterium]